MLTDWEVLKEVIKKNKLNIDPNWQQGYDLVLFHNPAELPKIIEVELGDEWGYDG